MGVSNFNALCRGIILPLRSNKKQCTVNLGFVTAFWSTDPFLIINIPTCKRKQTSFLWMIKQIACWITTGILRKCSAASASLCNASDKVKLDRPVYSQLHTRELHRIDLLKYSLEEKSVRYFPRKIRLLCIISR